MSAAPSDASSSTPSRLLDAEDLGIPPKERIFLWISASFLLALIVANVFAASKLIVIPLGFHNVTVAAGILAYPVTFLATDLISELYGKKRADFVVVVGLGVSIGLLIFIEIGRAVPALSPEMEKVFADFFSSSTRAIVASMIAYLVAQLLDVRLFHFWKRFTGGKHLWLRNNGSTVGSQLVDTILVTTILFWGVTPPGTSTPMGVAEILPIIRDGFIFKGIVALFDTPLLYLGVAKLAPHIADPAAAAPLAPVSSENP